MRRLLLPILLLLTCALLVGCSEDETTAPVDDQAGADPCLSCHGNEEQLQAMLPERTTRITNRGDG